MREEIPNEKAAGGAGERALPRIVLRFICINQFDEVENEKA